MPQPLAVAKDPALWAELLWRETNMLGAGRAPPGMERVSQGNVAMLTVLLKASAACDGGTGTWFSV